MQRTPLQSQQDHTALMSIVREISEGLEKNTDAIHKLITQRAESDLRHAQLMSAIEDINRKFDDHEERIRTMERAYIPKDKIEDGLKDITTLIEALKAKSDSSDVSRQINALAIKVATIVSAGVVLAWAFPYIWK